MYRHFPNGGALVLAVYRHDVQQLVDAAPALPQDNSPLKALRLWLDRLAYYDKIKHALAAVLYAVTSDGLVGETYGPVIDAITSLLRACKDDGTIRAGLDPDDILLLLGFLWRIDPNVDWEAPTNRILDLIMDGVQVGAHRSMRLPAVPPQQGGNAASEDWWRPQPFLGRRYSAGLSFLATNIPAVMVTAGRRAIRDGLVD
jgi:AcrR family transcriptional regulator